MIGHGVELALPATLQGRIELTGICYLSAAARLGCRADEVTGVVDVVQPDG
jgi:hypothetical protein